MLTIPTCGLSKNKKTEFTQAIISLRSQVLILWGTRQVDKSFEASVPALGFSRKVSFITIPHYLSGRLLEMLKEL